MTGVAALHLPGAAHVPVERHAPNKKGQRAGKS